MEQRDWSHRATEHAVEMGVAYDDRGNDAPSDADSTETDPDMPTLVPVECSPEWTDGQAPDLGQMTLWCVDDGLYNVPSGVGTVIKDACGETTEGLFRMLEESRSRFNWFNKFLRVRHHLYINGIIESPDGKATVRITECPVRGNSLFESRLCRLDGKRWTLGQTLEWALNNGASYNWALDFWKRDFVRGRPEAPLHDAYMLPQSK